MGLGLSGGFGAGAGSDALERMLAQRFKEEIARREAAQREAALAEETRQFDAMMPIRERDVAVDEGMFGLKKDELAADAEAAREAALQDQLNSLKLDVLMPGLSPEARTVVELNRSGVKGINLADLTPKETKPADLSVEEAYIESYAKGLGKPSADLTAAERLAAHEQFAKSDDRPHTLVPIVVQGPSGPMIVDRGKGTGTPVTDAQGNPVGRPLSGTEVEKIAGSETGVHLVAELRKVKNNDWLGPAAGRWYEAQQYIPGVKIDPNLARFIAESATLENAVIKAITGAQMSEPEAKRIQRQIPRITDKPEVWEEKARATKENMSMMAERIKALRGQGGAPPRAGSNPATADDPLGIRSSRPTGGGGL